VVPALAVLPADRLLSAAPMGSRRPSARSTSWPLGVSYMSQPVTAVAVGHMLAAVDELQFHRRGPQGPGVCLPLGTRHVSLLLFYTSPPEEQLLLSGLRGSGNTMII